MKITKPFSLRFRLLPPRIMLSGIFYMTLITSSITLKAQHTTVGRENNAIGGKEKIWDVKALFEAPAYQWQKADSTVWSLIYSSLEYDGKPTKVFAYYSNPDIVRGQASSGKRYPGIILIHGGGGKAFPEWVAKWAREGYAAIAMDLSGKEGSGKLLPGGGPDQSIENKITGFSSFEIRKSWSYHAVGSVILAHSLLLSLPGVDTLRTAVTGISWGGYLTCMVAGLDHRFKAAVPVYGCGFFGESDVFKRQLARLSAADRETWLRYYDPAEYLYNTRMPVLFMNGNKDKHFNVVPYQKTYELVPSEYRYICIKPDMKHSHPAGWNNDEIALFLEKCWQGTSALPLLRSLEEKDSQVNLTYTSKYPLTKAVLYYTDDTTSLNEKREWHSRSVHINNRNQTVTATLPEGKYAYAFIYLEAENGVAISTPFFTSRM